VAGREGKRGECQTGLVYVWRETGAVRNARPSRGQAAVHPEEGEVGRRREATLKGIRTQPHVSQKNTELILIKHNFIEMAC